jgi:hypothetical protein
VTTPVEWVRELRRRLAAGAGHAEVVAWLGGGAGPDGHADVIASPAPIPGAASAVVRSRDGTLESVEAYYPPDAAPLLPAASRELGTFADLAGPGMPLRGAFALQDPVWRVLGATPDPPGATPRRLVELAVIRRPPPFPRPQEPPHD